MTRALGGAARIDEVKDDDVKEDAKEDDGLSNTSSDLRLSYLDDVPLKTRFPTLKPPAPVPADIAPSKPTTAVSAPSPSAPKPLTIILPALSAHKPLRSVTDILRELKDPQTPGLLVPVTRFGGAEVAYSASALQGEAVAFASALADSGLPSQPSPPSLRDHKPSAPPSQSPTNQHD